MTALLEITRTEARKVWGFLHGVMGDQAYERYLEGTKRTGAKPLCAKDFYLDSVKRRYSTVSRCC